MAPRSTTTTNTARTTYLLKSTWKSNKSMELKDNGTLECWYCGTKIVFEKT
jgi:hypothetical protein